MVMVALVVEPLGEMTLGADGVAGRPQRGAVGLVAVRAGDSRVVHPTLDERAPLVDLAEDLAVRVVERGVEESGDGGIEKRLSVGVGVHDGSPAGMTARADIELRRGPGRSRPLGDAALAVLDGPRAVAAAQVDDEAVAGGRLVRRSGCGRSGLRPGDVG